MSIKKLADRSSTKRDSSNKKEAVTSRGKVTEKSKEIAESLENARLTYNKPYFNKDEDLHTKIHDKLQEITGCKS